MPVVLRFPALALAAMVSISLPGLALAETLTVTGITIEGQGFRVSRSDLELTANVPGIDEEALRELAQDAKANCPISKLLNAEMNLDIKTTSLAT